MKKLRHLLLPPIVPMFARKALELAGGLKQPERGRESLQSGWRVVRGGALRGRSMLLNPEAAAFQREMLDGVFDKVVLDYVDQHDWSGKVIYDIGAHIGYHTLNFAHRVGAAGRVFSFEPHPMHQERIKMNLSGNADLAARVTLMSVAAGNSAGRLKFHCTESIESGDSSASFIEGASTPFPRSHYAHHHSIEVGSAKLDDLVASGQCAPPDLIKIDVEGAESLVIEGALEMLRNHSALIVMEVHSLPNMMRVVTFLLPLGYSFTLLEDEDRRCFVAVEPPGLKTLYERPHSGIVQERIPAKSV